MNFRPGDIGGPVGPIRPIIGKPVEGALNAAHSHIAAMAEMLYARPVAKNQRRCPSVRNFTGCGEGVNDAEQVGDGFHSPWVRQISLIVNDFFVL